MKTKVLALALFASALLGFTPRATADVSFSFFYDSLSPYGEWMEVGNYGNCWTPTGVDADWSPYTDGYWSYTDAGWTWVSYEDWGGIVYHYGRWVRVDGTGWCWVPDTEWGPAWVSWRHSDEHVGWAPLPPEAHWRPSVGISIWADSTYDIGPSYYNFCPVVEFGAPLIRTVILPRHRNITIIHTTVNITNITYNSYSRTVFCGGPDFGYINERAYRPVPALKLVQNVNITNININKGRRFNSRQEGNTLQVIAPRVVKDQGEVEKRPKIARKVGMEKVNRGWKDVPDQAEAGRVREKVKQETKGLNAETAPAKPVKPEDLKVLPEKADPKAKSPVASMNKDRRNKDKTAEGAAAAGAAGAEPRERRNADREAPVAGEDRPEKMKPGKVAQEQNANRGGKPERDDKPNKEAKAGKVAREDTDAEAGAGRNKRPGAEPSGGRGQGGFQTPDRATAEAEDATPQREGKKGQNAAAKMRERNTEAAQEASRQAEKAERQRQNAQAERQQQAEKQQRQQAAAAQMERQQQLEKQQRQAERQQQGGEQARRQQQAQAQAQQEAAAQRQMQAQRQQKQAEAQQRIYQAQREQQLQRQQNMQRQQAQGNRAAPPVYRQPQGPAPGAVIGGGGGGGGGGRGKRGLTPEEVEAMKKQKRGF